MTRFILALPLLVLAAPAVAAGPYVELGAGVVDARANDVDQLIDFSSAQNPSTPAAPAPADRFIDDVFGTRSKPGLEASGAVGWDFGFLRLEGELAHRQVRTSRIAADDFTSDFLSQLNGGLNRPSAAPDPGAPGLPALTLADFQRPGHIRSLSAMANAILDAKVHRRLTLFAGGGYGVSEVRGFGDKDRARSWQYMLGLRVPVSDRLELGLKHRYFDSGMVTLDDTPRGLSGNIDTLSVGGTPVNLQTNAGVTQRFEGHWRTRSVQLTAGWKF
jgi:opacity protein-like surface antigen